MYENNLFKHNLTRLVICHVQATLMSQCLAFWPVHSTQLYVMILPAVKALRNKVLLKSNVMFHNAAPRIKRSCLN